MKDDLHAGMQGIHNIVLCDVVDTLQKYVVGNLAIFNQGSTILCDDVDTLLEKAGYLQRRKGRRPQHSTTLQR